MRPRPNRQAVVSYTPSRSMKLQAMRMWACCAHNQCVSVYLCTPCTHISVCLCICVHSDSVLTPQIVWYQPKSLLNREIDPKGESVVPYVSLLEMWSSSILSCSKLYCTFLLPFGQNRKYLHFKANFSTFSPTHKPLGRKW